MLAATARATTANTPVSTWPLTKPPMVVPISTPTNTAGPHDFNSSMSTAPRRWWARAETIDVGMIVASDVPTAMCMRTDGSMSSSENRWYSTGTMTMPPPTPNSPARMPATTPVASSATESAANQP